MNRQSGSSLLPGGGQEVPNLDAGWETYQKIVQETVVSGSDIDDAYQELRCPMAPSEALEFALLLLLFGASASDAALKVVVPGNAAGGGFTTYGIATSALFRTEQYGSDDFNTFVGTFRGGSGGVLDGWDFHRIEGSVLCGDDPGLLRFQLQGTGFIVKQGSLLRVRRAGVL